MSAQSMYRASRAAAFAALLLCTLVRAQNSTITPTANVTLASPTANVTRSTPTANVTLASPTANVTFATPTANVTVAPSPASNASALPGSPTASPSSVPLPPGAPFDLACYTGVNASWYTFSSPTTVTGARYCIGYTFKCAGVVNANCNPADAAANSSVTVYEAATPSRLAVVLGDRATFANLRISSQFMGVIPLAPIFPPPPSTDVLCWNTVPIFNNGSFAYAPAPSTVRIPDIRWCIWYDLSCRALAPACNATEATAGFRRTFVGMNTDQLASLQYTLTNSRDFGVCTTDGCNSPSAVPPVAPIQPTRCLGGTGGGSLGNFVLGGVTNVTSTIARLANTNEVEIVPGGVCYNASVTCTGAASTNSASFTCNTIAPTATQLAPVTIMMYGYSPTMGACKMTAADPTMRNVRCCAASVPPSSAFACNAPDSVNAANAVAAAATPPYGPSSCFNGTVAADQDGRGALAVVTLANYTNSESTSYSLPNGTQVTVRVANMPAGARECVRVVYSCVPGARGVPPPECTTRDVLLGLNRVLYAMQTAAFPICAALRNPVIGTLFSQGSTIISCSSCANADNCNAQPAPSTLPSPSASPSTGASPSASSSVRPSALPPVQDWPAACHFGIVSNSSLATVVNRTLLPQERIAGTRCASFMRRCTPADVGAASCNTSGMVVVYGTMPAAVCTAFARGDVGTLLANNFNGSRLSCCSTSACNVPQVALPSASPASSAAGTIVAVVVSTTLRFASGSVNVRDLITDRARLILRQAVAAALRVLAENVTITAVRDETGARLFSSNVTLPRARRLQTGGVEVDTSISTSDAAVATDVQSNVAGSSFASIITTTLRTVAADSTDAAVQSAFLGANVASVAPVQVTAAVAPSATPAAADASTSSSASVVIIVAVVVPVVVVAIIIAVVVVYMNQRSTAGATKKQVLSSPPASSVGGKEVVVLQNVAFSRTPSSKDMPAGSAV